MLLSSINVTKLENNFLKLIDMEYLYLNTSNELIPSIENKYKHKILISKSFIKYIRVECLPGHSNMSSSQIMHTYYQIKEYFVKSEIQVLKMLLECFLQNQTYCF